MANYITKPEEWLLLPEEKQLLMNRTAHGRFGFAVHLKFFQIKGRFPYHRGELNKETLSIMSEQLKIPIDGWYSLDWEGRTIKRIRAKIREWCGFQQFTSSDYFAFKRWLTDEIIPQEHRSEQLREALVQKCGDSQIEPPASGHTSRLIHSVIQEHDDQFCNAISHRLESATLEKLDNLLVVQQSEQYETEWTAWQNIKVDPGKAGIKSVGRTASRLSQVRQAGLPMDLFKGVPPKLTERYAKRAAVEQPFELRRHAGPLRATLLASYLHRRSEELTDHLVDLIS